jgi:hypothetical protein
VTLGRNIWVPFPDQRLRDEAWNLIVLDTSVLSSCCYLECYHCCLPRHRWSVFIPPTSFCHHLLPGRLNIRCHMQLHCLARLLPQRNTGTWGCCWLVWPAGAVPCTCFFLSNPGGGVRAEAGLCGRFHRWCTLWCWARIQGRGHVRQVLCHTPSPPQVLFVEI